MRTTPAHRRLSRIATTLAAAVTLLTVLQSAVAQSQPPTSEEMLDNFVHYTLIDRPDLAQSYGRALLDSGLSPVQIVDLIESSRDANRFERAMLRAQNNPQLEEVVADLLSAFEQGKRDRARDANEITQNIELLTGTPRQRLFAREFLIEAGEYAMPQLLDAVLNSNDARLRQQASSVIVEIGKQAVMPLVAALQEVDPVAQEIVIELLGNIGYDNAIPFLMQARADAGVSNVRRACDRAIDQISRNNTQASSVDGAYVDLAERYYQEEPSLVSYPDEEVQLLWRYNLATGLYSIPVHTEIFHEALAMNLCERALTLAGDNRDAARLWIAANFHRELQSPADYENPVYASDRRDAMYYAVAAGAELMQGVLGWAVDAGDDTPLVRSSIEAISRTAGSTSMIARDAGRNPLLESLRYPSRRVQYEAAIAIGQANPATSFEGMERVVPTLAGAIRDVDDKYALVIAADDERQSRLVDVLDGDGYTVIAPTNDLREALDAMADVPGIDLVAVEMGGTERATQELIEKIRRQPRLRVTPVYALLDRSSYYQLDSQYRADRTVELGRSGNTPSQISLGIADLITEAVGGPITAEEARAYQLEALRVLRDIAVASRGVLSIADAEGALVIALENRTGQVRVRVAEVLSYIPTKRAQVTLMDAAMTASGDEQITLLNLTAESAKRFGNMLERRQVSGLVEMAKSATGDQATAAAALMGALNLPNNDVVPLILDASE